MHHGLLGAIALILPAEPTFGWLSASIFALVTTIFVNLALMRAIPQPTLTVALKILWADSLIVVGAALGLLLFCRLMVGPNDRPVNLSSFYRGMGMAVVGGAAAGWLFSNVMERMTPSVDRR